MSLVWDGEIPLLQVLTHVRPAYGGQTWDEALAWLQGSPGDAEVIANLARHAGDGFECPIRVCRIEPDDEEDGPSNSDGWSDEGVPTRDPHGREWQIGNGMHRVATAVLLGHDTIRCTSREPEDEGPVHFVEAEYLVPRACLLTGATNTAAAPDAAAAPVTGADSASGAGADEMGMSGDIEFDHEAEAALTYSIDWLRSFPLPGGTWVEADFFGGHGHQISTLWRCPSTHVDELFGELERRCPGLEVLSWRGVTGEELDAEYEEEFAQAPVRP